MDSASFFESFDFSRPIKAGLTLLRETRESKYSREEHRERKALRAAVFCRS